VKQTLSNQKLELVLPSPLNSLEYLPLREVDNEFDSNAIEISLEEVWFTNFVSARLAKILTTMIEAGRTFIAKFVMLNQVLTESC